MKKPGGSSTIYMRARSQTGIEQSSIRPHLRKHSPAIISLLLGRQQTLVQIVHKFLALIHETERKLGVSCRLTGAGLLQIVYGIHNCRNAAALRAPSPPSSASLCSSRSA